MKLKVICVGKLKEAFWKEAVSEYVKRLGSYCQIEIMEVKDEPAPENLSQAGREEILLKEGRRILEKIPEKSFVIGLEIQGKRFTSEGFSKRLSEIALSGSSEIVFLIGGSLGLSQEARVRENLAVSFSDMTFPHQLMRVILLEQIYRAYKIMKKEPYHK
ncbi:MAG: 23S rRNA (pseudouridine(1915)-N(3))-methyltransferase RlmH [Lachnospiraceae bacterium]|nr:23S rRNA (pseudouridine(1915)-N(3))-methyltransferase RlmH [Lachnospiraceae bacterium]